MLASTVPPESSVFPEFAQPLAWGLLPAVVLWLFWQARRRRYALPFPDLRLLAELPVGRVRWGNRLSLALQAWVLLAALLAVANPRWPDRKTRIPTQGIAILFVIDVSPSMDRPDFVWQASEPRISRLEAAKRAFRLFVEGGTAVDGTVFRGRPSDQIGLVTFARQPRTVCPLTLSHSVMLNALDRLQRASVLDSSTNIGDALAAGLLELDRIATGRKVLILLSDGQHEVRVEDEWGLGPTRDDSAEKPLFPRQAAQLAANLQVPIYALDCGGPVEPKPVGAEAIREAKNRAAGRQILQDISRMTGGQYWEAFDGAGLRSAYQAIDQLEREEIRSFRYRRYHESRPWCILAALLGFVVWLGLEYGYGRGLP